MKIAKAPVLDYVLYGGSKFGDCCFSILNSWMKTYGARRMHE